MNISNNFKYLTTRANGYSTLKSKSKGYSNAVIKPPKSDNTLAAGLTFISNAEMKVNFESSCSKEAETYFIHRKY